MDKKGKRDEIALFRFGVISSLIHIKETERGEREKRIRAITETEWDMPWSGRSFISRSTILEWLKRYTDSGNTLASLEPKGRRDKGQVRSMDTESQEALVNLRKEYPRASLPILLKIARERKIITYAFKASLASVYRLFKQWGVDNEFPREDRRKFEAETVNDLWQADCMHGPYVQVNGKKRKTFLEAIIDDYSRLIVHAEFYLRDTTDVFLDTFEKAIRKRGLPRKLYVDNGPSYRSHKLRYITASLGVVICHATPYVAEGKGKIERWFRTVRMNFLPCVYEAVTSLDELNEQLGEWIEKEYHVRVHSSTRKTPIVRYAEQLHMVRPVPHDVAEYFRLRIQRKVGRDRIVSVNGTLYEAPLKLIGKTITLRFHNDTPEEIEAFYKDQTYGYLMRVNPQVNYRIGRESTQSQDKKPTTCHDAHRENLNSDEKGKHYSGGELFDGKEDDVA